MRRKPEPSYWTPERLKAAWELVENTRACDHCGGRHARACPRVKRMAYYPQDNDGVLKIQEVEFFPHGEWPHEDVIFADLLPFEESEDDDLNQ